MRLLSRPFASTVAALALCLAAPWPASACSCSSGSDQPCELFQAVDAVFVGRVTGSSIVTNGKPRWTHRVVRLAVIEGFSGVKGNTIEVQTGMGGGDCGFGFETGRSYFVYASRSEGGAPWTSICSATKSLAWAQADLAFARQVVHGGDRTRLYGRVIRSVRESAGELLRQAGLGGITVTVEGPDNQRLTAVTDAKGRFSFAGRLEGAYTVRAATPDGLPEIGPQHVTIPAGRCSGVELESSDLASLAGRVVDSKGRPVSPLLIELLSAQDQESVEAIGTRGDGRYLFDHIPPGSYVLAINPKGTAFSSEPPYPRTFFPHAVSPQEADRIVLRPAEAQELTDFEVPPPAAARTVSGVVRWPDGRPAAGIHVSLNFGKCGVADTTDAKGRFKLTGYEGYTYTLTATTLTKGSAAQAEPEEVEVGGEDLRFELVLDRPRSSAALTWFSISEWNFPTLPPV